jgi:hypothetical protein
MSKTHSKALIIFLLIFGTFFTSCTNYIQLYHLKPIKDNLTLYDDDKIYGIENDTVAIRFDFWYPNGILMMLIENKIDKPIYIDWKKSSLILNDIKLNFWEDHRRLIALNITVII